MNLDKVSSLFGSGKASPDDPAMERVVRSAIRSYADGVDPSDDAYTRLATSVASAQSGPRPVRGSVRLVGATAAAALSVAVGAFALSQIQPATIQAIEPGSAGELSIQPSVVTAGAPETEVLTTTMEAAPDDSNDPGLLPSPPPTRQVESLILAGERLIVGGDIDRLSADRVATVFDGRSRRDAAQAFLEVVGFEYAFIDEPPATEEIEVWSPFEGAPDEAGRRIATLQFNGEPVQASGTVHRVVGANSDDVADLEVTWENGAGQDPTKLRVSGRARGWEGAIVVSLYSAVDGALLAQVPATAGAGPDLLPFSVEVPVAGRELALLVVQSTGGADGVTEPFSAVTVVYDAPPSTDRYTVVRIPLDDPDDGLVLRSGPGESTERLGVLDRGLAGIRRLEGAAVRVGSSSWWRIETADGDQGWVNSSYLANTAPFGQNRGQAYSLFLGPVFPETGLPRVSFSRRMPVRLGTLSDNREFNLRSAADRGRLQDTLASLRLDLVQANVDQGDGESAFSLEALSSEDRAQLHTYFGALDPESVRLTRADGSSDHALVYYEQTPAGPEVLGAIVFD